MSSRTLADSSQTPGPSGFIERAVHGIRLWWTERHYRSVLGAEIRERVHRIVEPSHTHAADDGRYGLLSVVVPDFRHAVHSDIQRLGEQLEQSVERAAANAIDELRTVIDLNVRRIDDLQAELLDSRNLANATHELADPPTPDPLENDHVQHLRTLAYQRAARLRRRLLALAAALVSALVISAEGTLVYLSLLPVFGGVVGISGWMLPVQAVVITMGMLFLAHASRRRGGTNTDWRWLSRASLCLTAAALAVLRAGVLAVHADTPTMSVPIGFESWGLLVLVLLAGVVLAVLGAAAYERAGDLFRQADAPWTDSHTNLLAIESAVAFAEADRERHQICEQRRRRFHARVVQRARRLESEVRRTHRDTRALLHREVRQAHMRLAPAIRHVARQLAHWRHDVGPSAASATPVLQPRLLLPLLVLGVGLLGANCGIGRQVSLDYNVLLDTSGSMPAEILSRIQARVLGDAGTWVRTAPSGSTFTVWWLSTEGAAFPAQRMTFTVPALKVPAHRHRQRLAQQFENQVTELFGRLPHGVLRTRLLESVFYIASTADGQWRLVLYSDLQQDSESWDAIQRRLDRLEDEDVVSHMLTICPPVRVPPAEVLLRSWPGLLTQHRAGIHEHRRYRELFRAFFTDWAPTATVRVGAI